MKKFYSKTPANTHAEIKRIFIFVIFLTAFVFGPTGCRKEEDALRRILAQGKLTVITHNSAHGYYIYREQPMGVEYDLAREFADYLQVELEVITPGWNDMFAALEQKQGDLIAASLTNTPNRSAELQFSTSYMCVQQQIVVRKGNHSIQCMEDLDGKTVHVRKNTSYHAQLVQLQERGIGLKLHLYDNSPTEEFLRRIHDGEIDITVADSNIIALNQRYYPGIRTAIPLTEEQGLGWAVRPEDPLLLKRINAFFRKIEKDNTYNRIYRRYYSGTDMFDYFDIMKFHERIDSRLPAYKDFIVRESERYGFDWRLIAAMIYQESHFNPRAKSFAGAHGLMQLTARTAESLDVTDRFHPENNIIAGIGYLHWLYGLFDHIPAADRMKFALAGYNIGYGHIQDALKIARKKGLPPDRWISLKKVLPLLRDREYFADTRYGYARGTEPIRYVEQIQMYYDILKNKSLQPPIFAASDEQ